MVVQFFKKYERMEEQRMEHVIVHVHTLAKGLQVAYVLTPVIWGSLKLLNRFFPLKVFALGTPGFLKILNWSGVLAPLGTEAMTHYMLENPPNDLKNRSRAFRLARNHNQYYLEDWTYLGNFAGATLGLASHRLFPFFSAIQLLENHA